MAWKWVSSSVAPCRWWLCWPMSSSSLLLMLMLLPPTNEPDGKVAEAEEA